MKKIGNGSTWMGNFDDQDIYKVSRFAWMKVYHNVCTGLKEISEMCRIQIKATFGLPCPYQLRLRVAAHATVQLNDFHAQLHLKPLPPLRFFLLPSDQVEEKAPPSGLITLLNSVAEGYPTLGPNQQADTDNVLKKLAYQRFRAPNEPRIQRTRGRPPGAMNQISLNHQPEEIRRCMTFCTEDVKDAAKLGTT